MAASILQEWFADDGGGTSTTQVSPASTLIATVGSTIEVWITDSGAALNTINSVVDSAGQTYTLKQSVHDGRGGQNLRIYVFPNNASATHLTITVTWAAAQSGKGVWVKEIGGVKASSYDNSTIAAVDTPGTGSNAVTTSSISPVNTAPFFCSSLAMECDLGNGSDLAAGTGYTLGTSGWTFGGSTALAKSESKSLATATSTAATFTAATNGGSGSYLIGLMIYDASSTGSTSQYFGEEAELWDYSEGVEPAVIPGTTQQSNASPPPDDAFSQFDIDLDDDEWITRTGDTLSPPLVALAQPPEDAWVFDEDSEDNDEWVWRRGTDTTVQVLASTPYLPDDAWNHFDDDVYVEESWQFIIDDDDDAVSTDNNPLLSPSDEHDFLTQDEDDWYEGTDPPIADNNPQLALEDSWNHFEDFDEDQWPLDEFSLRGTHVPEDVFDHFSDIDEEWFWLDDPIGADNNSTAQYFGEDAETAELDIDDDDWLTRDSDSVGANLVASVLADDWDFTQDDDDWWLLDDYSNLNLVVNAQYYGDDAENADVDFDDDSWITAIEPIGPNPTIINAQYYAEDAENADVDFDDDEWTTRDTDAVGPNNIQPPSLDDAWDWSQEDDEYLLDDASISAPPLAAAIDDPWNYFDDADDDWQLDEYAFSAPIGSPVEDAPVFDDEVSDSIDEFLEWQALSANLYIPPSQFTDDSWWYWTDEFLDDYEAVGFDYAIIGAPVNPKPTQLTVKCAKTKCSVTTATTQLVVTIYEPKLGLF